MRKLRHEEIPRPDPAEVALLPKHPISVVVDNVRSIHNVGSIFRTSDAASVEHVYLAGISGTPDHPAVHKTALGAQDTVPWSYCTSAVEAVQRLKQQGYAIGVLEITDEPTATTDVARGQFPMCMVVGNELHGVDEDIVGMADLALEVPQFGAKQSLNVAVAYGIAVFDLVRTFRRLEGLAAFPDFSGAHRAPLIALDSASEVARNSDGRTSMGRGNGAGGANGGANGAAIGAGGGNGAGGGRP